MLGHAGRIRSSLFRRWVIDLGSQNLAPCAERLGGLLKSYSREAA